MNVSSLRVKYFFLNPKERAELFLAKAVPKRNDTLANAVKPNTLIEHYRMKLAELKMIVFGAYWLSKLCFFEGLNSSFVLSECVMDTDMGAASATSSKDAELVHIAAALALALHEFDREQSGWLEGVAAIMDCRTQWDSALTRGKILRDSEIFPHFRDHLSQFRQSIHSFWMQMEC